jgi:coproporphyrinogen III oxidase-like Fe-S oxidoreductase
VDRGWIVSVDFILGLPDQTLEGVLSDVMALEAAGVDGFSLYELQLSSRNRRFAKQCGLVERKRLANYLLLQAVSRQLASMGYDKTLFNHFARKRDTNLYFTFPEREEDCLALGTTADGVFGDYHYRHPEYKSYGQTVDKAFPGLQGGLRRTESENQLHPLETALLSAHMSSGLFVDVLGGNHTKRLFHHWWESGLVEDGLEECHVRLTVNGSWFVGKMMEQLEGRLAWADQF